MFITGGTGVIGSALVARLVGRGDEVVALARSDAAARTLNAQGAQAFRGDAVHEQDLARGMRGCELAFNVAGVNTLCVQDEQPMRRLNAQQPASAVRAAKTAGIRRLIHTSSAATIGEPAGTVGNEHSPHRGWYLSTYEQTKTEGERAALAAGRVLDQDVVCVNPASVQGPGRSSGTARFLLAFLDGRLRVFVPTNVSLVDVADCAEGHLLAAEHGVAGERYLLSGSTMTIPEALELAAQVAAVQRRPRLVPRPVATVAATVVELTFRLARRRPPVCREMVRTLLHGHRYDGSRAERELGLTYTPVLETLQRTVEWAREQGLLRSG